MTRLAPIKPLRRLDMPNATWREEKSEFVVKAICQTLQSPDLPESVRFALEGEALFMR